MAILEEAAGLLRETERKLRALVSAAATSGDYTSVVHIASWAQTVAALVNGRSAKASAATGSNLPRKNGKSTKETAIQTRGFRRPGAEYPQFFRHNDHLIRLAWSRGQRKEYIHKAPYVVLKELTKAMAEQGADGRVFSTDDFLPLQDKTGGDAVPNYQAYVGIALLKQRGLIDQHGRQGYSIPRLADFKDGVEAVWKKLPERQKP
jgi:hypothetical protein